MMGGGWEVMGGGVGGDGGGVGGEGREEKKYTCTCMYMCIIHVLTTN